MDEKNVVDMSSFMLFEATGDSEADSELNMADVKPYDHMDVVADDDDAESCSCDLLDCGPTVELDEFDGENLAHAHDEDHVYDDDDDDENLAHAHDEDHHVYDDDDENLAHAHDEDHHVYDDDDDSDEEEVMMSSMVKDGQHKKSRGCGDSAMELMTEMEKSRLFWETCLAS